MPTEVKMPALSPTMEEGTLAKWLVNEGDYVQPGEIIAEIETDKATMEFEATEGGRIAKILVPAGADGVTVGTVIALLAEGEDAGEVQPVSDEASLVLVVGESNGGAVAGPTPEPVAIAPTPVQRINDVPPRSRAPLSDVIKISPLAARIATANGIDIADINGTGPHGRIVKADLGLAPPVAPAPAAAAAAAATAALSAPTHAIPDVPHQLVKLSNMRKTIARRLTESKQQVPHIYLTVDVQLDALLRLRAELNDSLEARGVKLSINDMIIKAIALALIEVSVCNVQFAGDQIAQFKRADISVAVSIPNGLITPVITAAERKSLSAIATEMKDLAARARDGKLQPREYHGGTASLSNLGMFDIKQFEAVINPPQAMIMAVGTGDRRAHVVGNELGIATVMSATGSFDHRAIDGADAAALMQAFKRLIETPLRLLA